MSALEQSFGELLKEFRLTAGLSQEELAERARLSVDTISALERGRRQKPYRHTIDVLAEALQLTDLARHELERASVSRGHRGAGRGTRSSTTVALLFTAVAGGVSRWEQWDDATAELVERHGKLVRSAVDLHHGQIFRTTGTKFSAQFERVEDAAGAAIDVQRAAFPQAFGSADGLPVRVALHVGRAGDARSGPMGADATRGSALLDVGYSGQVLTTASAYELLRDKLPDGTMLRDLGRHRLRDLARLETIYELRSPELDRTFPPLRSAESFANNLPTQTSSFIGREAEVETIEKLLSSHRFITLLGAGGVGKTRIALQVAADQLESSRDGVWFVDFAMFDNGLMVTRAIASGLSVQESAEQDLLSTLVTHLKNKQVLLLFDNCEHLVEHIAEAAKAILQACPGVRILATSREPLNAPTERAYRVPSLSVPAQTELRTLTIEDAMTFEAIALFVDRAQVADDRFVLTEPLAPIVAAICSRLDGVALAIELAAARIKVFPPPMLAAKLDEHFLELAGGLQSALPHHTTIRALLAWSYDLLGEREQLLIRRLSMFVGGFTLDLASAVSAQSAAIDSFETLNLVASLLDKSLIQADIVAETTRYRLLEVTREFAREKLLEMGEYDIAARSHAAAMLALAERFDATLDLIPDHVWTEEIKPEIENWRAAVEWAFGPLGDTGTGQQLAGSLGSRWFAHWSEENRRWIKAALRTCDDTTPLRVRAKLELADARVGSSTGQTNLDVLLEGAHRALRLYEQAGDRLGMVEARAFAAQVLVLRGDITTGESEAHEALGEARACRSANLTATLTASLAIARYLAGDLAAARSLYAKALLFFKSAGCHRAAARETISLAEIEFQAGNVDLALQLDNDAIDILRKNNDRALVAALLANRAAYLMSLRRFEDARESAREAIAIAQDGRFDMYLVWALQHLATIAVLMTKDRPAHRQNLRRAARMLGFVEARYDDLKWARGYTGQQEYDCAYALLRNELQNEWQALITEGKDWSQDLAVAEAASL